MKRRDFLKTSAAAAGLAASVTPLEAIAAGGNAAAVPEATAAIPPDNRPADYLHRMQGDRFLPKPPAPARTYSISPMPLSTRVQWKVVPRRGFCCIAPAKTVSECLTSGNGAMRIELMGDPYAEQILFHHESLLMPWKRPLEAPKVADIFARVRQMVLDANHGEAMSLALERMNEGPIKQNTEPHLTVPAFLMQLDFPTGRPLERREPATVKDYLRTVDFESGEVRVYFTDENDQWLRQTFASRPDNVVVQWFGASKGKTFNVRISLQKSAEWSVSSGMTWGSHPAKGVIKGVETNDARQVLNEHWLMYKCRLDPSVDNSGYAGVTRVVRDGGTARIENGALVIENASSLKLLTRIEYFADYSDDKADALRQAVEQLPADYRLLMERHRKVQSEMLNRVTVDFGGASQFGMSVEELLSDQRSRSDFSPALLEKLFEMGRHWFIINSGKYPSIAAEVNSTINLQTAGAAQGGLREGMDSYFNWMESLASDCRANAKNIFGCRGTSYPLFPDKGIGVSFYYTGGSANGVRPYWISAGGWCARPFWDHYLVTGDLDFLRHRVVPVYRELALFYEDFLTATDKDGNYIFAPSFSPENVPVSTDPSAPALVNAAVDIAVCREVLGNLVRACQTLGIETDAVAKWKGMLAKMPPYLLELDGTLKEWAWPTVQEHFSHRHVSHLYGAWPGDEIDPDRTPQLARAAVIANRRRTFDTMSTAVAGETLPAYARCHRALAGARLKDNVIVDVQLRQLMEQGYVSSALRCSRETYGGPVPDAQAGIPAILMEMLLYARPGVIEVLPALPRSLVKGSISGLLARTFARIDKLAWDMEARTVDLKVTSARTQDVTLIARHGIEEITAPAGVLAARPPLDPQAGAPADCVMHLPEGRPVELHLKLGPRNPFDWTAWA